MSSFLNHRASPPTPIEGQIETPDGMALFAKVQGVATRLSRGPWSGVVEIKSGEPLGVSPGETVRLVDSDRPKGTLIVMSVHQRQLHFRSRDLLP